ncbi:MAG TPA: hypothetical protein VH084_28475 [Mycobacterium sp.]|jgi:hypothetical protein|nr:hypothetical protein [Mycobacterium sp.]
MTAYVVRHDQSASPSISILAVTWPIRLASITFWSYLTTIAELANVFRYDSGVASGGAVAPVIPMRQGAPAATATARIGTLTLTGTFHYINSTAISPGQTESVITVGTTLINVHTYGGSTAQIQFPLTTVISPGSSLVVNCSIFGSRTGCEIYFEELRLQGSY